MEKERKKNWRSLKDEVMEDKKGDGVNSNCE